MRCVFNRTNRPKDINSSQSSSFYHITHKHEHLLHPQNRPPTKLPVTSPSLLSYASAFSFPLWLNCLKEQNIQSPVIHLPVHSVSNLLLPAFTLTAHTSLSEVTEDLPYCPVQGHFLSLVYSCHLTAVSQTSFTGPFISSRILTVLPGISFIFLLF